MKRQISFFCAVVAGVVCLTATTFGQVLKVEPEKPKWGDKLKITYDPSAPGATFTGGQNLHVLVGQITPDNLFARSIGLQNVAMMKVGKMLTCEVEIRNNVSSVSLVLVQGRTRDRKSRQRLMVYGPNGQPVKDAFLSQASGKKTYQEWIDKELVLYPDNYRAYYVKWQTAHSVDLANFKNIIEADINHLAYRVKGEPLDWLFSLAVGYLYLGQEEKSREVLRRMVAKYPNAPQTSESLNFYQYESRAQRFTGAGPDEVNQMTIGFMKRNPTSDITRWFAELLASDKTQSIQYLEKVLRRWIKDEPQNPKPYYSLVSALNERGLSPEQSILLSDKALELLLNGKAQEQDLSDVERMLMLPRTYYYNAHSAFNLSRYAQAYSAVKAAQALNTETPAEYLLLEGNILEKVGMLTKAEQTYLTALQRGSKEAAAKLKSLYLQDGGVPDSFENWLSKRSAETGAATPGTAAKKSFANFSVTTLAGKKYDLAALRGKVVVLNFWFIGCGPCHAEMPELNKLVKDYESRGVVFLAATRDDVESIKAFQKEKAFNYEILPDTQAWADELGVRVYPTHYVINGQGEVELMLLGGQDKNLEQIRNVLARLTAGK